MQPVRQAPMPPTTTNQQAVDNVTKKLNLAELASIKKNNNEWLAINTKMKNSHSQLVTTNSIAIKNHKILSAKLIDTETKIKDIDESIAIQTATIENNRISIEQNDKRLSELSKPNNAAYTPLVDDQAKSIISAAIQK